MSNPTTSLEFSRKVFEIIGGQKTYFGWVHSFGRMQLTRLTKRYRLAESYHIDTKISAYTFSELIRVIPLIAEKKGWKEHGIYERAMEVVENIALKYVFPYPNTPEQGMKDVEAYLMKML